jgi:hypothetical protein
MTIRVDPERNETRAMFAVADFPGQTRSGEVRGQVLTRYIY